MLENANVYFSLLLILLVFLVGLTAFVGGLKSKPNPFFWRKNYKSRYLKTPMQYVLFGLVSMLAAIFFAYRAVASMGLF